MKTNIRILGIIILLLSVNFSFAQTGLSFTKKNKPTKDYTISGKSGTFEIKKGKTKTVNLKLKEGQAYFISVSGKHSCKDVHYRLIDGESIIYDNSVFEFATSNSFFSESEKEITLEIINQPDCFLRTNCKRNNINFIFAYKNTKGNENNTFNSNGPLYVTN